MTLQDETAVVNVVVWAPLAEAQRKELVGATLLLITGQLQRDGDVLHLIASHLEDYSHLLDAL